MKTDANHMMQITERQRFDAKLARIAELAELNSEPEFGGTNFRRYAIADMTAARIASERL